MVLNKLKELTNSGFGSNINNEGERLITKDGKFNVKKEGVGFFQRFNLFHWLINMSSLGFFTFLVFAFFSINIIFTTAYLIVGIDGIAGTTPGNDFFDAFYFSFQTLTTVGYGGLHPTGRAIGFIASFEAFVGLLSFAVSTGLLYGRFSKPKAKLMFSNNALLSPYQNIKGLMIRVANPKNNQLINATAKMIYSQVEDNKRRFYPLTLEMEQISLFATSWTIVHPINEESPVFNLSKDDFLKRNAEIILLLSAFDESYNQTLHTRTSYKAEEIITNAKFISAIDFTDGKQPTLRLDKLNDFEQFKNEI